VHGRAEGTAAEAQWAIDTAQQLMRQLMLRMVVAQSHPFSSNSGCPSWRPDRRGGAMTSGRRSRANPAIAALPGDATRRGRAAAAGAPPRPGGGVTPPRITEGGDAYVADTGRFLLQAGRLLRSDEPRVSEEHTRFMAVLARLATLAQAEHRVGVTVSSAVSPSNHQSGLASCD
jgi:hypothetical protein